MTVIACFGAAGVPVLMADTVISSPLTDTRSFFSPAAGDLRLEPTAEWAHGPEGYCQKIVSVSDNLWFAWAGHFWGAWEIAEVLTEKFGGGSTVVADDVYDVVRSLTSDVTRSTSIVGICRDERGLQSFGIRCETIEHPFWGPVLAAGSGVRTLRGMLDSPFPQGERRHNPVALASVMAGCQLGLEAFEGRTLREHFGGYFEIAYVSRKKFVRLDDATHLFWHAWPDPDRKSILLAPLPTLLRASYMNDRLVLRRTHPIVYEQDPPQDAISNTVVVPSLRERSIRLRPSEYVPPLSPGYTVHVFVVERGLRAFVYTESPRPRSISIVEEGRTVRVLPSERFFEKLRSWASDYRTTFLGEA
jgi:hypothetical protein